MSEEDQLEVAMEFMFTGNKSIMIMLDELNSYSLIKIQLRRLFGLF